MRKILKNFIKIGLFASVVMLIIISLYYTCESPFEKLIIGAIEIYLLTIIIPFTVNFLISLLRNPVKNNNKEQCMKETPKTNNTIKSDKAKYKHKVVITEGYTEFNNLLKVSIKNKLIDRNTVLSLKYQLINILGTHFEVYKDFTFKNDLHCIYILSKSSKLTKENYSELSQIISNNLILPK